MAFERVIHRILRTRARSRAFARARAGRRSASCDARPRASWMTIE